METDNLRFTLTDGGGSAEREVLRKQIRAFNDAVSEHHRTIRPVGPQPLDVFVYDGQDRLVGGLTARTYWGWLELEDFWLDGALRGCGYGRQLLSMVETEAIRRGCTKSWLRTYSFQAKGFYEKAGYRVVGTLEDYPPGEAFYWMQKDLMADS
jgi:GNAT superfamily N-acetyltransferase